MKRPRKAPDESAGITWNHWQRLRKVSEEPKLETPAGRLAFLGEFTSYQWSTIEKVEQIYADFDRHYNLRRWAASPSFEVGIGRSPVFEDDDARDRAVAAKRAFSRLQGEICHLPRNWRAALEELVIQKRECPPSLLPQVKMTLDILAGALGFRAVKKRLDKSMPVSQ